MIGDEERQTIDLTVPFGVARSSTSSRQRLPRPIFGAGSNASTRAASGWSGALQCAGEDLYLAAGHYRVRTWDRLGDFETVEFDAAVGTTVAVPVPET